MTDRNEDGAAAPQGTARTLLLDAPFAWDHAFDTGIAGIDVEHEAIAALVAELYASSRGATDAARARAVAARLAESATAHFAHEERLMDASGYHGARRHKEVHKALLEGVGRIAARLSTGHPWHAGTLAIFVEDFLFRHVAREDIPFAKFLREKGMVGP